MKTKASSDTQSSPWKLFETGAVPWTKFSPRQQEQIVRHYAPKIRIMASRLKYRLPRSVELSELISAGSIGLVEALGKFQPDKGIQFETYADNRIRGSMIDELRKLDWFPRSLRQRLRTLEEIIKKIEHDTGSQPTEIELHKMTGYPMDEIRECLEALQNLPWLSLETIEDIYSDEPRTSEGIPYDQTSQQELASLVAPLIKHLSANEQLVLSLYYTEGLNMREIAEVLEVSESRVSQLHAQALRHIRRDFKKTYEERLRKK